jgi:predicted NBD/HSP70 family sugar kinase
MIVAVDTGGTKTLVAVFDTEGRIVSEQKFPTPKDVTDYVSQLKDTIDRLTENVDITCLSVALPGVIEGGVMITAGNLDWHDTDIKTLLADHYDCPIIVENDANLAGLAEARALEATPPVCLYVTVSTGIGTGVILNGKIHPQLARTEGGHILLSHNGAPALWESFASGKALKEATGLLASEITDETMWQSISDNIAQGLLAICPFLRPDVIIIGGGVGTHFAKFSPYLLETMGANLENHYSPTIVQAVHPEEAVVYGCYYHALDSELA